jgi:hypothetical protein
VLSLLWAAPSAHGSQPRAQPLLEGNQACQAVGNLCVLTDYNIRSTACLLFRFLQSQAGATTTTALPGTATSTFAVNQEWRRRMPGLYYPGYGVTALSATAPQLTNPVALPPQANSRLRYVLARYSLNGAPPARPQRGVTQPRTSVRCQPLVDACST